MIKQKEFTVSAKEKGFHLITEEILSVLKEDLQEAKSGLLNLFLKHTSASLFINENYDPSVRVDMQNFTEALVPETFPFTHTLEGPDDMPAHIKSALYGVSVSIPVKNGALDLGTWQGIYLAEHKENAGPRKIVATLVYEK